MLPRRLGYASIGSGIFAVFALVGALDPSATGHGTHQQLGLAPCTFATATGRRCPSCGVTTACCYLARGEIAQAAATHFTGTVLAMGAMVGALGLWGAALTGWPMGMPSSTWVAIAAAVLVASGLIEWIIRLAAEGFG